MLRSVRAAVAASSALVVLAGPGCATAGLPLIGGRPDLLEEARPVMETPPLDQLHWGIYAALVDSVETGDGEGGWERRLLAIGEENAARKFVPASNVKIPVTAAALFHLGPEYRYETAFYATGERDGQYLRGDLIVPARGDPTLGEPFHPSGETALEALADSLVATGIRIVEGALVVDASLWDSTSVPESWTVGNVEYAYGASGGAFAVDRGSLLLEAEAGFEPGRPAMIRWSPLGEPDFVVGQVETVDGGGRGLRAHFLPESRRIDLSGALRPGQEDSLRVAIRDPVHQAAAALHRILRERGVEFHFGLHVLWDRDVELDGGCRSGSVTGCAAARRLAGLESPPLTEIVEAILARSENWMSEQLVRTLGELVEGEGSWDAGLAVVSRYLEDEVGVAPLDFVLRDGSGLSGQNLVTPRALVATLEHMDRVGLGLLYRAALAAPGMRESTLEERLTDLEGRLHAKTGTIAHVNSLSGYLVRDDGEEILFSVLTNGSGLPADVVREAIDEVVRALARTR